MQYSQYLMTAATDGHGHVLQRSDFFDGIPCELSSSHDYSVVKAVIFMFYDSHLASDGSYLC